MQQGEQRMNLDIKQMKYLVTLADVGNFTHAAKLLYTSQPSLSTFVSKVEAELGVTIFDRGTSPLTLTTAGDVYIRGLREICEKADEADRHMADIINNDIGILKVGFPVERAASMLPYILPAFKKMYPNIEVKVFAVSSQEMMEMIAEKRITIGIIPSTRATTAGIGKIEIYEEELFLVDGGGYIKREHLVDDHPDCVDLSRLNGIEMITLKASHAIRQFQEELFEKNGVKPRIVMEVPSNSAAYRLVSAGTGTAIIPALTINMVQEIGDVRTYRLLEGGTCWTVLAIYGKDQHLGQVERDFIMCTREELQKAYIHLPMEGM